MQGHSLPVLHMTLQTCISFYTQMDLSCRTVKPIPQMGMFSGSRLQTRVPNRMAHQRAAPGLTLPHCLLTNHSNILAASKHKACAQLNMTDLSFLPLSPDRVLLGTSAGKKVLRYHQNSVLELQPLSVQVNSGTRLQTNTLRTAQQPGNFQLINLRTQEEACSFQRYLI